ncbi:hypothetical protein [Microbulbifer taiwanensis]|uniref:hypothetical protein n=1 Tax=Microbulbifer taiwanensis TaxID=986746 RepID=UPI0036709B3C
MNDKLTALPLEPNRQPPRGSTWASGLSLSQLAAARCDFHRRNHPGDIRQVADDAGEPARDTQYMRGWWQEIPETKALTLSINVVLKGNPRYSSRISRIETLECGFLALISLNG